MFGESSFVGVNATQNPNPDLKWERTEQISAALDFGFMDNRLAFTLEGYVKNTKDLLLEVNVPQPAVEERRLENIGKIKNTGFEFSFDHVAVDNASVTWSYGLVFDLNRNEVVDLGVQSFISERRRERSRSERTRGPSGYCPVIRSARSGDRSSWASMHRAGSSSISMRSSGTQTGTRSVARSSARRHAADRR